MRIRAFTTACAIVVALGLICVLQPQSVIQAGPARVAQDASAQSVSSLDATTEVTVHPESPGRVIPRKFLGFSYEAPVLAKDYFDVHNKGFMHLLNNLGTGVLRFGGNSVEFTYWSPHGDVKVPKARAVLDQQDLNRLFAFSKKVGWPVMLGLNLGHYDPGMAADEAAYAVKVGGSDLLALEIGNEPDLFSGNGLRPSNWGYADYLKQFQAYVHAIRARMPDAPISGPTTCCTAGLRWFPHFLSSEGPQLVMATFHNYPMSASRDLSPSSPRYPTIHRMLSPELMNKVKKEIGRLVREAHAHQLPLRMAEVNSASSGGKNGVSNVFASALWGADYSFTLAELGVSGLNFHGGFHCGGYTPVCISEGRYTAQPLYYGMLLFHAATPGRLVPVDVRSHANMSAYGVLASHGGLHLVLINKEPHEPIDVRVSGLASYRHATVLRLTAPSLSARSRIAFGGHPVEPNGKWFPGPAQKVARVGEAFHLRLPAASAALVNFRH